MNSAWVMGTLKPYLLVKKLRTFWTVRQRGCKSKNFGRGPSRLTSYLVEFPLPNIFYCSSTESNRIKSLFRLFNGNFSMDVLNKMDVTKAYKCKVSKLVVFPLQNFAKIDLFKEIELWLLLQNLPFYFKIESYFQVCPYMTRFKSNLLKHIRVHTGENFLFLWNQNDNFRHVPCKMFTCV